MKLPERRVIGERLTAIDGAGHPEIPERWMVKNGIAGSVVERMEKIMLE